MKNVKCPVCKRIDERVQLIYVPLGHGRFSEYICCECKVVFPFGSNKFGDITDTEQIKEVADVNLSYESNKKSKKEEHEDFTPEVYCTQCKKLITRETRRSNQTGWQCSEGCKVAAA